MKSFLFCCLWLAAFTVQSQTYSRHILTGADQMDRYLPLLKNKKVALLVNQTSVIQRTHLVDTLLDLNIQIAQIFAPEHGFRGTGDAGEKMKSGIDAKTGLRITSMYGASKKPSAESMKGIDVVVFDIQDVGARFYTYISSLQYMMEACAESKVPLIILDRPNPNGFYVDGPVLERKYASFVGMQSIPIVHGMTVGEYARMLNGEGWLSGKKKCTLTVIPCLHYDHSMLYELPIAPSPNLKSSTAILLYPSLCLFEGTDVSVGRGTTTPFELWGHPTFKQFSFAFTPVPMPGAKTPPHLNKTCYGRDLRKTPEEILKVLNGKLNLSFLQEAYQQQNDSAKFFNSFFEKLSGTAQLRLQIIRHQSDAAIRKSWEPALTQFKKVRKKYLLYPDFAS
ncbi:MAG TPA: DUF1343 domain-containing protein [Chitinophagaceae bacterium]|nr:DUF1343 domain-containing protein [Chitinophagaceae bacterium]